MGGQSPSSSTGAPAPPPTPIPQVDTATTAAEKALSAAQKQAYDTSGGKPQKSKLGSTGAMKASPASAANVQASGGKMGSGAVLTG